ncbi:MAG TPA: glycosyltransferase family 1 protein [Polyangiaceae bacterium]|jgi:glycosyltransferase involved in cell wall biosynthesis|nr:glycosyltransferase family 1 protein [Polyangiaceae bacterium]
MKIVVDARYLGGADSGVGNYSRHLLTELVNLDPSLELTLIVRRQGSAGELLAQRCRELVFRAAPRSISTLYWLPQRIGALGADLFHGPFNILPSGLPCPGVVTIHDIMQLQNPNNIAKSRFVQQTAGLFWRTRIRHAVTHASRVFAVSEATRDALLEYFPSLPEQRVVVTPNGVDPYYFETPSQTELESARSHYPSGRRLFLCVGNESPHKNHFRAIQAFVDAFGKSERHHLVIVRRLVRHDSELERLLAEPAVKARVTLLDHVDRPTLRALYAVAHVFFFPSWIEGFGIPILEAMAVGTPVLTSDRNALCEVAGDAALMTSPFSPMQMAQALQRLDSDNALRERLVLAGKRRAAEFSWRRCAEATLLGYHAALAQNAYGA